MVIVVRHTVIWLLLLSLHAAVNVESFSSVASQFRSGYKSARTLSSLDAKPQRLQENVDGVVYVNDKVCSTLAEAVGLPNCIVPRNHLLTLYFTFIFDILKVHQLRRMCRFCSGVFFPQQ
jgi:hypothetical protein